MEVKDLKVVFMGTPEFASHILQHLVENNIQVVAAVSPPDRPAGRGHKLQASAVKQYAQSQDIPVLQPEKLKNPEFLTQLASYNADVFVVVAFRMLPKEVWQMPAKGTFNLHGSLLPQYRGAAPINWAIINGETESGVTSFFIDEKIDTGHMILSDRCAIGPDETAGELHDRLMHMGAATVLDTLKLIAADEVKAEAQQGFYNDEAELRDAPKIFKDTCQIHWDRAAAEIHNHIRGLSPYPAAWATLTDHDTQKEQKIKVYRAALTEEKVNDLIPGTLVTDGKNYIKVASQDYMISILELQIPGKKKMKTEDLLRGFDMKKTYQFHS